jgi:hypothetical protein
MNYQDSYGREMLRLQERYKEALAKNPECVYCNVEKSARCFTVIVGYYDREHIPLCEECYKWVRKTMRELND